MINVNETNSRPARFRSARLLAAAAVATFGLSTASALANTERSAPPKLETNQRFIEGISRPTRLNVAKPMSVFQYVIESLPKQVTVYPTEGYYYFSFTHMGREYAGNVRFDIVDRDKGKVHFAYFRTYTEWRRGEAPNYRLLSDKDGVVVKKVGKLAYTIAFAGKTVRFDMVDLSHVKPPKDAVSQDEVYIGPVFDESGIQFYLMFNKKLKVFHYVLNEAVAVGESLFKSEVADNISIGWRTGFAYYRDPHLNRKILVGVYMGNSRVNNYYDGPFDQLPDNFIKGNVLHDAIIAVDPGQKGRIDRLGNSAGGASRFFIGSYMYYEAEEQLAGFAHCMGEDNVTKENYGLCLAVEPTE